MEILAQEVEHVPIGSLKPHPDNPRDGDTQEIRESLRENGFYRPLIVRESNRRILAGNHTWEAATKEGYQVVPVVFVNVTDEQARRILLVDNRTNDLAEYDDSKLADVLEEMQETEKGLAGTGFDDEAVESLLADLGRYDPTEEIEVPQDPDDPEPELDSECRIVIHCSAEDRDDFFETLNEWDGRESVEVDISG